ncbi:hypothetical protein Tco_1571456 [Tanacetum coccineum]
MPRCIAWDKVDNLCPQSNPQVLPSFEVYTLPATYPKEVEKAVRIPIEVEPLDHTKLEDLGLNTCNHDLFLSSREIPSVYELGPQLLPNFLPLDVNLGDKIGTDPPINPSSPGSFQMKEFLKKEIFFFTDPRDGVRINPDGVARPATGKFDFYLIKLKLR